MGTNEFAGDFRKNGACCQVDVGIDPYGPHCDCDIEKNAIRMDGVFSWQAALFSLTGISGCAEGHTHKITGE
jgi:hypothetical protein